MPKETNFNLSPYFDDFDPSKNFYQVLFKPGYPIQSRELTTLQSILQNQIEQFGNKFFKEGSIVIPGQLNYNNTLFAVEIEPQYLGVDVDLYGQELVGKVIRGENSKVTAKIIYYLNEIVERNTITFYIRYLNSGENTQVFQDSEVLLLEENFSNASVIISSGQGFANTIQSNSVSTGSGIILSEGVYYLRGSFVSVSDQILILDPHGNTPTYKIGFEIIEEVVTSDEDSSLYDNARGFNNFSAPGADRFKITAVLTKRATTSSSYPNFVQLLEIQDGVVIESNAERDNPIATELARRTFDESGDYYVKPFTINIKETLDNKVGNGGIYSEDQLTSNNNVPSDDLATYKISPGKAYVRGYEVATRANRFLDFEKPRTTSTLTDQSVNYFTGSTLALNRVYGSPTLSINSPTVVSLRSERVGSNQTVAAGKEIGVARVYDFALESGSYDSTFPDSNVWDLSLFDIQPYTDLTVNKSISLSIPTRIVGKSSGAVGFLRYETLNSGIVTAYNTKGEFLTGEQLQFDSSTESRVTTAVREYGVSDSQSLFSVDGSDTFNADIKTQPLINVGSVTITSSGIVTSTTFQFSSKTKVGQLVSYSTASSNVPSFGRIISTGNKTCTIEAVEDVSGVCSGSLPSSTIQPADFKIITTKYQESSSDTLFTEFPSKYVSDVDLSSSSIAIKKQFSVTIASNSTGNIAAGTNETFLPFDEERYTLTRSDGTYEELTADKFEFLSGSSILKINGLGTNDSGSRLIATLKKTNLKAKVKNRNKVKTIIVDKSSSASSGIGTTSLNDGLTYGNYPYGTRVQDKEICLNNPDVTKLLAVVESTGTGEPDLEQIGLSELSGDTSRTTDLLLGEKIIGKSNNAVALVAEKVDDLTIGVVYLNENRFEFGESLEFVQSGITGVVESTVIGDSDITSSYTLDNGYENTIYGYSKIVRKDGFSSPTKQIKIVYSYGYFDDSDTGDFVTVNSYSQYDYCDIPKTNKISHHDILDIRPRVEEYTPAINTRSPFEFYGRSFTSSGTAKNILASDESLVSTVTHYLPRVDRLYLSAQGVFEIVKGTPSDQPTPPPKIDGSLEVATVSLPAYMCNIDEAIIDYIRHRRYQMKDIFALEERISNLEFYTTLSLLESKTESLQVQDSNGLNKFKSGFVVDNFTTNNIQNKNFGIKNSIDSIERELRPSHYCTEVDLLIGSSSIIGIGTTSVPNQDISTIPDSDLVATGIKRTNKLLSLSYEDEIQASQPFATRVENITPYLVTSYTGIIELNPSSDVWIDTNRLEANVVEIDNFTPVETQLQLEGGFNQNGFGPVRWGSWRTTSRRTSGRTTWTNQRRTATQTVLTESITNTSQGDSVVSTEVIAFLRSRNIEFISQKNKPQTRVYPFFGGVDMSKWTVPKLIQIQMISGTFQVGETVEVRTNATNSKVVMKARVAKSNHKYGSYNDPSDKFTTNPYNQDATIPTNYSPTSTILNIDTFSLSNINDSSYYGYIRNNYSIRGLTSKAEASISDLKLITDNVGTIIGSLFIPNPNKSSNPKFENGETEFVLTSSETNSNAIDPSGSLSLTSFTSEGTIENVQENIISVRSAEFSTRELSDTRTLVFTRRGDPLAQTFKTDSAGAFITKAQIYFKTKDSSLPVIAQLRTVKLGLPTEEVLPFSEVVLNPENINLSDDATVATTIQFNSLVYLNPDTEYSLVLLSDSNEYTVFISRLGETDITTASGPESQQIVVTEQPSLGSLFKSQNGSTWTPSQYEDLKFTLYRAKFTTTSGKITFYNPKLDIGNEQIINLPQNPLTIQSDNIRVGLGTTLQDSGLELGNTISQINNNASGDYVGSAGSAFGDLTITNSGIGYTPSSGALTYNNVPLVTLTGSGSNATANIAVNNGVAVGATISNGGIGYQVGDTVTVSQLGTQTLGQNLKLTVGELSGINELVLNNVEGDFEISGTKYLQYFNSSNTLVNLNASVGGNVLITQIESDSDGLHIKVNHKNHGMHSNVNIVEIRGVGSDQKATKLSSAYSQSSSSDILLENGTGFDTFEGQPVTGTNPGYVVIDSEIISYTGTNGNNLTGITRGIDSTDAFTYSSGTLVSKYENSGVSLRRINKQHNLNNVTIDNPIGLDYYHIKLDMSQNGVDRSVGTTYPKLYLKGSKSTGGSNIFATQNIQFEVINPRVQTMILDETSINSSIRTISATSIDSNQVSFVDQGFETVDLNTDNYLGGSRMIASQINEDSQLNGDALPGKKSFTLDLELSTSNTRLSPIIDLDRVALLLITNRINSPITNYATDPRVAYLDEDPSAFTYATDDIELKFSATSLKVKLSAYINVFSDLRAFYAISNTREENPVYYPFPGFNNIDNNGDIINPANSDGLPDTKFTKTDVLESENPPYQDFEFNIDNLPTFRHFSIKLIGSSTSQAYPPRVKEFSTIALA